VLVSTPGTLNFNIGAQISARGGDGGFGEVLGGGGGGGGRVRFIAGTIATNSGTIDTSGGTGGTTLGSFGGDPGENGSGGNFEVPVELSAFTLD
jgi:hypothetical protein